MSAQKRPAQEPYASSQLVKRARDQGDAAAATAAGTAGTAVAVVNTASQNGALIQAVRGLLRVEVLVL
ncbi:hypothetical protein KEM52_005252 [Ascosphaera acerosa]|nr:hypothetical protein KEM52_005252 [Ascosphaera acerosa]